MKTEDNAPRYLYTFTIDDISYTFGIPKGTTPLEFIERIRRFADTFEYNTADANDDWPPGQYVIAQKGETK